MQQLHSVENARDHRKVKRPREWWEMIEDGTPEFKRFVIFEF